MRKSLAAFALAAGIGLVGSPAMAQETASTPAPPMPVPSQTQGGPDVQPFGTTCIQGCSGWMHANVENKSSQYSFTYDVGFTSGVGVGNARMQVRMLDQWNNLIAEDNHFSPAGYRHSDSRKVGRSYVAPVTSVCHTLWEGAAQLGTACTVV